MDDKTIIDITNLDAEKHAENAAKRVASYSEKLLHHASILSEKEYQKFLLERLEKDNGYVIRKASNFDRYFAVDREMLFKFLEDTQHETMEYLRKIYKSDLEETIVSFINAETTKTRGSLLDVLKHGIEISNQKLELMYTKPATTFNPDLTRKYGQNIFSAMEEVWASDKERIDVVIFLNGLAIIAFELKCNAAGQSYQDAIYQFRTDRSPKTRLFMFKAGTLVNFAMDLEEVYMTTKLAGDATFFLPFNMGNGEGVTAGAGNPAFEDKYSVSYMWEDILTKDTILDLISKFIFVETKEKVDDKTGKIKRSENLIFPRYHQLDVIRKVLADVRENRTAQNYLIQHSAGSGKTNSIAWLAHRLTSLHDAENKIIFDNIIIVKVQNKMHYAVHGHTAAELIYERADADKPHMGLTTWAAAPEGKIVKSDVSVAKNYLSEKEMRSLERIVSAYLDLAEDRAERHIPMTMEDWAKRLDLFLMADDREVLQDAGKITAEIAKTKAETEFEKYRVIQDRLFMSDFDKYMLELEENAKK